MKHRVNCVIYLGSAPGWNACVVQPRIGGGYSAQSTAGQAAFPSGARVLKKMSAALDPMTGLSYKSLTRPAPPACRQLYTLCTAVTSSKDFMHVVMSVEKLAHPGQVQQSGVQVRRLWAAKQRPLRSHRCPRT